MGQAGGGAELMSGGELRVVEGPDKGLVVAIAGATVLGRDEGSDVVLGDQEVSRRHLRVALEDGHPIVEDLGSSNGTFVNGRRISGGYRPQAGDRIKLGVTVLEYVPAQEPGLTRVRRVPGAPEEVRELRVLQGPAAGRTVTLARSTTLGRDPACDLVLADEEASRHHARVTLENGTAFIEDLRSTNGTFVDGERIIERQPLDAGDVIQVGSTTIEFAAPALAETRLRAIAPQVSSIREVVGQPGKLLGAETGARKWWTLLVVCIGVFMLLLDTTIVSVALPSISNALKASFSQLQFVIDAYALTLAAALLTAGSVSDVVGRRLVFVVGLGVFTGSSLACGLAGSATVLDVARGVQGLGGAMMFATSLALLAQEFPPNERGMAFGIWGAAVGAATAIGPLVGGLLIQAFSWQAIFYVNIPIGIVVLVIALVKLVNIAGERAAVDWLGLITFSGAIFMLVLAIISGNEDGWTSGPILGLLIGAVVSSVAFVAVERRASHPMLELELFGNKTFVGALVVAFSINASIFAVIMYFTLWLQSILSYSALQTGLRLLPLTLLTLVFSPLGGRLQAKVPVNILLFVGLLLIGGGLLHIHSVINSTSGWTVLLPGMLVGGAGVGLTAAPLASMAVGVVPPWKAGMASGINTTFRQLGLATSLAALGAIFQHQILTHVKAGLAHTPVAAQSKALANAITAGGTPQVLAHARAASRPAIHHAALTGYGSGLSSILLVAGIVALVGAVFALVLIREKDLFPMPGPPPHMG